MTSHLPLEYLNTDIVLEETKNNLKINLFLENTNSLISIIIISKYDIVYHMKKNIIKMDEEGLRNIVSQPFWSINILQNEDECRYININKVCENDIVYLEILSECNSSRNIKLIFNYNANNILNLLNNILEYLRKNKCIEDEV